MLGFKRYVIAQFQRGFKFRDGRLIAVLAPGVYSIWDPRNRTPVVVVDVGEPEVNYPRAVLYVQDNPALCEPYMQLVEVGANEVGLVYKDGRLSGILMPGARQLYWKGAVAVEVRKVDIEAVTEVEVSVMRAVQTAASTTLTRDAGHMILRREVPENAVGLLFIDGCLQRTLAPGVHGFWKAQRQVQVDVIDLRLTPVEVQGQEILTKDKVSLRVNLSASYRVIDPVTARTRLSDYKEAMYRELQFGLRQAVGTRTLDELLGNKGELDAAVAEYATRKCAEFGIALVSVGVRDIILPGEMKTILNQVVEAEKAALANVIRRREETAATRSLLNTARLMEASPVMMRLKELETLEKVTGKIDKLTVFGGLEGVLEEVKRQALP